MKDYKLSELKAICKKYTDKDCNGCPMFDWCEIMAQYEPSSWDIDELKPKYKKGDTVYMIEWVGKYGGDYNGSVIVKEPVAYKVKEVHIMKTKVSYSLYLCKRRIDEKYLHESADGAQAIIDRNKTE